MCRALWSKGIQRSGLQGFKVPVCACTSHFRMAFPVNIRSSAICGSLEQDDFSSRSWGGLICSASGFVSPTLPPQEHLESSPIPSVSSSVWWHKTQERHSKGIKSLPPSPEGLQACPFGGIQVGEGIHPPSALLTLLQDPPLADGSGGQAAGSAEWLWILCSVPLWHCWLCHICQPWDRLLGKLNEPGGWWA